jgi:hypothetical protein
MRVLVALTVAVGVAGCFNPTYQNPECSAAGECPDGLTCGPDNVCRAGDGEIDAAQIDAMIDAPDAMPGDANLSRCDLRDQSSCPEGWKCTAVIEEGGANAPHCVPNGDIPLGAACEPYIVVQEDTGYRHDECQAGSMCISNECKLFCNVSEGPASCGEPYACVGYGIIPEDGSLGICEATCDPVTQVRLTDGAAWCNSLDTVLPERTCVGVPNGPFTCAPTVDVNAMHGTPVPPPVYLNSCAAGFMPLLQDASGNPYCVAMCSPAPTSMLNPQNAGGAPGSGYTCSDRGANAAECRYIHILQDSGQPGYGQYNNVGICLDYQNFGAPSCTASTENDTGNGCWPI